MRKRYGLFLIALVFCSQSSHCCSKSFQDLGCSELKKKIGNYLRNIFRSNRVRDSVDNDLGEYEDEKQVAPSSVMPKSNTLRFLSRTINDALDGNFENLRGFLKVKDDSIKEGIENFYCRKYGRFAPLIAYYERHKDADAKRLEHIKITKKIIEDYLNSFKKEDDDKPRD